MATAGLFVALDFTDAPEDEFHTWYDSEHLPERLRMPGFLNGERWIGVANPKVSVATYDLQSLDVLQSTPYLAVGLENASPRTKRVLGMCKRMYRVACDQILPGDQIAPPGAGGLLINAMNVDPRYEEEFNAWLDTEHIPALAKVPGTLCARRFRSREGSHRYFSVYHLTAPEVVETPEWTTAARSPWQQRMLGQMRDRVRIVCRRHTPAK